MRALITTIIGTIAPATAFAITARAAPARPVMWYAARNRCQPIRRSTIVPVAQRKHILPNMCEKSACRYIDVRKLKG